MLQEIWLFILLQKEEREKIIITDIFFNDENISMENFEDKLDISELTLKNDLKVLENYMKTFIISLDSKNLTYHAVERNIRRIILDILLKNYNIKYLEGGKIKIEKNYQYEIFLYVGIKWTNIFLKQILKMQ